MIKKVSITLTSIFLIILSYQIFNEDIDKLPKDSKIDSYDVKNDKIIKKYELIDDKKKQKKKKNNKKKKKKKKK